MAAPISTQNKRADLSEDRFYSKFKQDPHTKTLKDSPDKSLESLVKSVQKSKEDGLKMFIEMMKMPNIDIDGGGNKHDNTGAMLASYQSSSAQAAAAEIAAKTAKIQQEAARMGLAQMIGQKVKVANTRFYSGKEGAFTNFQYNVGKNLPSDARVTGTITVLDKNKKRVYSEQIRNMKPGENIFKWNGLNDVGKAAKPGQYSLQVKATYTTADSNAPLPVQVNTMTESEILEVDVNKGEVLLKNGSKFSINDIAAVTKSKDNDLERKNSAEEISKASNYLGKNIILREDRVEFNGSSKKLGFNSDIAAENIKVKIIAKSAHETKSLEIKEMKLSKGRNEVLWKGDATITESDLDAKAKGQKFGKVGSGNYSYNIYISEGEGYPWRKMSSESTVFVEATEYENGQTMLVLEDGSSVPETSFYGFAKESLSSQDLVLRSAEFVGKKVEVPRIMEYDGSNLERNFDIPSYGAGMNTNLSISFFDESGIKLTSKEITENQITDLLKEQLVFDNLDDTSKEKLYEYIKERRDNHNEFREFGDKEINYSDINDLDHGLDGTTNKAKIDTYIYEQVRNDYTKKDGYKLKDDFVPKYKLEWDGKDLNGAQTPQGTLKYEYSYIVSDIASGEVKEYFYGDYPLRISNTRIENNEIIGTLDDGREIKITSDTKFVA